MRDIWKGFSEEIIEYCEKRFITLDEEERDDLLSFIIDALERWGDGL